MKVDVLVWWVFIRTFELMQLLHHFTYQEFVGARSRTHYTGEPNTIREEIFTNFISSRDGPVKSTETRQG